MQHQPKPSTIVRTQHHGRNETYKLDGTCFRSYEITPEGTHVVVLDAKAADGSASPPAEEEVENTRLPETMSSA
jgi:hypothetical protein